MRTEQKVGTWPDRTVNVPYLCHGGLAALLTPLRTEFHKMKLVAVSLIWDFLRPHLLHVFNCPVDKELAVITIVVLPRECRIESR